MKDIRKLSAWFSLKKHGFTIVKYRFNGKVVIIGASLMTIAGEDLITIQYITSAKKWRISVDSSLIKNLGAFTLNNCYCTSRYILDTIERIKRGEITE